MEFQNEMQKNVYRMLASWFADQIAAGKVHQIPSAPMFAVQQGSAIVRIGVGPLGDKEAAITVSATVVTGATITGELLVFLLAHNFRSLFGAFGLNPENGVITLDHSIIGSTCDQNELMNSIAHICLLADDFDDKIIEKFGGKTALDVLTGAE